MMDRVRTIPECEYQRLVNLTAFVLFKRGVHPQESRYESHDMRETKPVDADTLKGSKSFNRTTSFVSVIYTVSNHDNAVQGRPAIDL